MCFCCSDNTCKLACPARTRPKGGHEKSYERMTKLSSGPVTPLWESTNSQALPYASKDQLEWTRQAGPGVLDSPLKDGYFQGSGKASDSSSLMLTASSFAHVLCPHNIVNCYIGVELSPRVCEMPARCRPGAAEWACRVNK